MNDNNKKVGDEMKFTPNNCPNCGSRVISGECEIMFNDKCFGAVISKKLTPTN